MLLERIESLYYEFYRVVLEFISLPLSMFVHKLG